MKFVSYAQNFEDVMLWRALSHITQGLYVDIGAQDPVVDSVSKAFYDRGWRGVHVEPVPGYANALRAARPEDTVLQVALAETDGTLELNVISDTGLSTAVEAYAQRHHNEHGFAVQTMQVPMLTMKSALAWLAGREVHWLKIDVEGLEDRVLRGWDSEALRPWIMLVEATVPNSRETDFAHWEPVLLAARYRFAYFDGLNRFYVAAEHAELLQAFSAPPNVFDEAQLSGLGSSELCRKLLFEHTAELDVLAAHHQYAIEALTARHQQVIDEVSAQLLSEREAMIVDLTRQLEKRMQEAEAAAAVQTRASIARLEQAREIEERRLHAHIAWQEEQLALTHRKVDELNQSSHHWWLASLERDKQIAALYASASWRCAAPLRFTSRLLRWMIRLPRRSARFFLRQSLQNPTIKSAALRMLRLAPGVEARLRQVAMRNGLAVSPDLAAGASSGSRSAPPHPLASPVSLDEQLAQELSPRAQKILDQFHQVINLKAK